MNDKHATGDTIQQRTNKASNQQRTNNAGVSKKIVKQFKGLIQIKTFWQN
jgi:hypothetical protein